VQLKIITGNKTFTRNAERTARVKKIQSFKKNIKEEKVLIFLNNREHKVFLAVEE
jgi:hypothetical protein